MVDDLAHEIKNPLNSMVINLELMRSRARKGDTDGVLARADVLETEVRRLNALIDSILKLMRPERVATDAIALDPVLAELGDLVGLQAKLARKALTVSPIGEAAVARGRREAIRFALLNLLAAELDAAAGDSARVDVDGMADDDDVVIRISARSDAGQAEDGAPNHARDSAIEMARALLHAGGGVVAVGAQSMEGHVERVVTVRLPRVR